MKKATIGIFLLVIVWLIISIVNKYNFQQIYNNSYSDTALVIELYTVHYMKNFTYSYQVNSLVYHGDERAIHDYEDISIGDKIIIRYSKDTPSKSIVIKRINKNDQNNI